MAEEKSKNLIDAKSKGFVTVITSVIGIIVVVVIIGVAWDYKNISNSCKYR